ncbi:hypothetical protein POM88_030184 [Heracleum sosnowskyi]|uniref:Uncharacterized protein n=1 Tax=Heracleum sosnowskyi TaxID=360622 RepID=A0AAD8HWJ0_9APIA|nr:hypothetical protein POM88_030184 [Heracleum sosnowskyi]
MCKSSEVVKNIFYLGAELDSPDSTLNYVIVHAQSVEVIQILKAYKYRVSRQACQNEWSSLYALIACVTGSSCCLSCFNRTKLRQQFFLHETPCGDYLVHCCCEFCTLCEKYRELKHQGFDMSIEKYNRQTEMEPVVLVVHEEMTR